MSCRATGGPSGHTESAPDVPDGAGALAGVRPEAIAVGDAQPQGSENSVSGTLASVSHLGDVIQFVVLTPGHKEILARLPRPRAPRLEVGAQVWCSWEQDQTYVFGSEQADIVLADPAIEAAPA